MRDHRDQRDQATKPHERPRDTPREEIEPPGPDPVEEGEKARELRRRYGQG